MRVWMERTGPETPYPISGALLRWTGGDRIDCVDLTFFVTSFWTIMRSLKMLFTEPSNRGNLQNPDPCHTEPNARSKCWEIRPLGIQVIPGPKRHSMTLYKSKNMDKLDKEKRRRESVTVMEQMPGGLARVSSIQTIWCTGCSQDKFARSMTVEESHAGQSWNEKQNLGWLPGSCIRAPVDHPHAVWLVPDSPTRLQQQFQVRIFRRNLTLHWVWKKANGRVLRIARSRNRNMSGTSVGNQAQ